MDLVNTILPAVQTGLLVAGLVFAILIYCRVRKYGSQGYKQAGERTMRTPGEIAERQELTIKQQLNKEWEKKKARAAAAKAK